MAKSRDVIWTGLEEYVWDRESEILDILGQPFDFYDQSSDWRFEKESELGGKFISKYGRARVSVFYPQPGEPVLDSGVWQDHEHGIRYSYDRIKGCIHDVCLFYGNLQIKFPDETELYGYKDPSELSKSFFRRLTREEKKQRILNDRPYTMWEEARHVPWGA